ncbi:MAG: DNA (cytosine-5-)-methyltransferase [Bacteroidota bacterium]
MRFIDLFAGLGGFHLALNELGHECVFASEKKTELITLYKENFEIDISGDINKVNVEDIPPHDIICAGFPCQPFSQAGNQLGLKDPHNGNFFDKIIEIANYHNPEYILLENVPNLKNHDNGKTWEYISNHLIEKYEIADQIISPHQLGVPQHRRRIYIVCRLKEKGGLKNFNFPKLNNNEIYSIRNILEKTPNNPKFITDVTKNHLSVWQEFLNHINKEVAPSFPIWAMEFGADYEFEGIAPAFQNIDELKKRKGKFGQSINGIKKHEVLESLPIYAKTDRDREFPSWKKNYIRHNRKFYAKHKDWLDDWIPKIINFENSHQKLEWNCGKNGELNINDKIVQFRPSGIRVKQPTFSPALVLTTTQVPIFPWLNRYMTINEAAKLQCMEKLKKYPDTFMAFGNAVNVCVVKKIAQNLII